MFKFQLDDESELRLLEPRHAGELYALIDSCRPHLRRWLPWVDGDRSVEDVSRFIDGALKQFASREGFQAGIWTRGQIAGMIGFHKIDWLNRSTSIGYWLGEGFQGRGLMTRACGAMVDHALVELGLNRVEIRAAVENSRSRAIPERLGFRAEGTIRDAEWLYDHFVDLVVYGMLSREWQRR